MKLKELYLYGIKKINNNSNENPELDAGLLLSKALNIKFEKVLTCPDEIIAEDKVKEFNLFLDRRLREEPTAYIVGEKEFYSRKFIVNKSVLIPRPETELLIESALDKIKNLSDPFVLDIGTGSGCIAIIMALEKKHSKIVACDISYEAIKTACINADLLGAANSIYFVNCDMNKGLRESSFDLIISNPPYVSRDDYNDLPIGIREFEPENALLAGEGGLEYINKIIKVCKHLLNSNGHCILEIGFDQSRDSYKLMDLEGFKDISLIKDYSGHERIIVGRWKV